MLMRLLLDHNVPDSVAVAFRDFGHTVQFVREILPIDSPDYLIATVAESDDYILVSCDKDFDKIAPRIPKGSRRRFKMLSRISLDCSEVQAANRVRATIKYIELAYREAQDAKRSMRVVVQMSGIRIAD